jgi:ketosteroid isomerase-like protein
VTTLEQVVDRLDIFELTGRYADLADQRDWQALTSLFTPTAVFDAATVYGAVYEGADAIRGFYETAPLAVAHHPTGVFTVLEGPGSARTRIKMLVLFPKVAFTVDYDWVVVKEAETWQIARQQITVVGRTDLRPTP